MTLHVKCITATDINLARTVRISPKSLAGKIGRTAKNEHTRVAVGPSALETNTVTDCDVVVIGSGIGGLSCASLLARYGMHAIVCESHSVPGGAAHSFERDGYHFESGPSLYSGMDSKGPTANPLALVLQAIDEPLELIEYDVWNVFLPETPKGFPAKVGPAGFHELLVHAGGSGILEEWTRLMAEVAPLSRAATALPAAAIRLDLGVILSSIYRYFPLLASSAFTLPRLTGPFSDVLDAAQITNPFIRSYLDLLCFLLSGLPADSTITAEVAFMLKEWLAPGSKLQFPVGGSTAMVLALVGGVTKRGGEVRVNAHVEQIIVENGKAVGVKLRGGEVIRARKAVVSNASTPDMLCLLPPGSVPPQWRQDIEMTPLNPSFMHLHLGFDATGLDTLEMHHIVVDDWAKGVTAPHNVVLISIASVADPTLAPEGKHVLHAYYPATEPWSEWEGLKRGTLEYLRKKEERAKALWAAVERIVPDIRERIEVEAVGTPLTHARYLRRHRGTYGPAWRAGKATFPLGKTPVEGLYCCGDFTFPGIGLPAVAASGMVIANSLVPLNMHMELLDSIGL